MTHWPDAFARAGLTPAHVRLWRVILLHEACPRGPVRLSPVARAIIDHAPERFKRGTVYSVRELADRHHYSISEIHRGLRQLVDAGYVEAIPRGQKMLRYRGRWERLRDQAA